MVEPTRVLAERVPTCSGHVLVGRKLASSPVAVQLERYNAVSCKVGVDAGQLRFAQMRHRQKPRAAGRPCAENFGSDRTNVVRPPCSHDTTDRTSIRVVRTHGSYKL